MPPDRDTSIGGKKKRKRNNRNKNKNRKRKKKNDLGSESGQSFSVSNLAQGVNRLRMGSQ